MTFRCLLPCCSLLAIIILLTVPLAQAQPSAPEGLQATVGKDYVDLSWQAVPGADYYVLYRGDLDEMVPIANLYPPFTAFHNSGLEEGSTYLYYVTAVDGGEESSPSNTVSVTVPPKENESVMLSIIALILSAIAIQVCVVLLLYHFKMNMKLK
ncbi:MAG: fibronectin type III domain-containing protein [Methanomassiliicoccales archaeon]|nr:fibronectin type III domain-containing protein [Methanomassiliicoccales archaeon]